MESVESLEHITYAGSNRISFSQISPNENSLVENKNQIKRFDSVSILFRISIAHTSARKRQG